MSGTKTVSQTTAKVGDILTYTTDFSYNASSRTLKLIADSVEPGQTKTFSFRVTVDEGAQGLYITNTAVVKSPDREDIQLPDTGVTIDGGQTAPSLTKTASKTEVKPGDIFTYTIKVKNGANATADWKNVTVSDIIPAGLEFVSGSVRVDGQAIAYGISGRALEIPVGDLNPNREAVVEFEVRVLDSAEGTTITNTAIGKGDNGDKTGTDPGVTVPGPTPVPTPTPGQPDTPAQQPSGTKAVDKTMDKAAYYDQKAQAAENNTAISSDDPEAITKLKDKLDKLKNKQSLMKQVNAYYRKHQTCRGCDAISPERAAELDNSMANAYSWETAPFPAWALSNNNAEIRRIEKRIAVLEEKQETGFRGWEFDGGRVEANMDANRLQVFFDEIPPEDVRSALKSNGFHWARSAGAWQRQLSANAIYAASRVKAICPSDGTDPRKLQPKAHPKEIER